MDWQSCSAVRKAGAEGDFAQFGSAGVSERQFARAVETGGEGGFPLEVAEEGVVDAVTDHEAPECADQDQRRAEEWEGGMKKG